MAAGVTDRLWSIEDRVALRWKLRTAGGKSVVSEINNILKLVFIGCAIFLVFSPRGTFTFSRFKLPLPEELEIPARIVIALVARNVLGHMFSK
jgi:hypothetical protein